MNLGIDDFTYSDLYSHARLRDLALTFDVSPESMTRRCSHASMRTGRRCRVVPRMGWPRRRSRRC